MIRHVKIDLIFNFSKANRVLNIIDHAPYVIFKAIALIGFNVSIAL